MTCQDVEPAFALRLRLTGLCNQCGLCCTTADGLRCEHLATTFRPVGEALATSCRVYGQRRHFMPIHMLDAAGVPRRDAFCAGAGSAAEAQVILDRGVGRGCSLTPILKEAPDA